jgi:hypothetical protein
MGKLGPNPSKKARAILESVAATMKLDQKVRGLSHEEDRVRRYILQEFPRLGRAPTREEIEGAFEMSRGEVAQILDKLGGLDIVYMREGNILGAYPFSSVPTAHLVTLEEGKAHAMCAIDALGAPFMFKQNATIESSCAHCGEKIRIKVREGKIAERDPRGIVVWAGLKCSGHAATSLCTTLIFLCSEDHLKGWREENPDEEGKSLSLSEALYVGKGFFEHRLEEGVR